VVSVLISCLVLVAINFRIQMRPEIFAFVLALGNLNLLQRFLATGRRRWLLGLLPVSLLWANSHGSFLINPALPWMFLAGAVLDDGWARTLASAPARRARLRQVYLPLAAAAVAVFLASLVNPYGLRLFVHAFSFSQADYLREHIVEFGSTFGERVRAQPYFKVYLAYLAVVLVSFLVGRRRVTATSLLLCLCFGCLSTDAVRFTAWFAIVGAHALAHNLAGLAATRARRRVVASALAMALAAGTAVVAARGDVRGKPIGFRDMSPMSPGAIEFIRQAGIAGNVFNTFSHGDQLVYHFYPTIKVAIDSRIDAYGEAYHLRYRSLCGRSYKLLAPPQELLAFLDGYEVNTIVTRHFDYNNWGRKGHVAALLHGGWKIAFMDPSTVILRRGS
jgi:hypothetical protein